MTRWTYSQDTVETLRKGRSNLFVIPPDARPNPPSDWQDRFDNPDAVFGPFRWRETFTVVRASFIEDKEDKNGKKYDMLAVNFEVSQDSEHNPDTPHVAFVMLYHPNDVGQVDDQTRKRQTWIDQLIQATGQQYVINDEGDLDPMATVTDDSMQGCEVEALIDMRIYKKKDGTYEAQADLIEFYGKE